MRSPARPLIPQWTRQGVGLQPMPIQQGRVMNGKAVLPEPSTHQSFISTAPTSVSLIYSRYSFHGFVWGVCPHHSSYCSLQSKELELLEGENNRQLPSFTDLSRWVFSQVVFIDSEPVIEIIGQICLALRSNICLCTTVGVCFFKNNGSGIYTDTIYHLYCR